MEKCLICKKNISQNGTPYSVCFDSEFESNVWGGDSHDIIGYLCKNCFDKIKR